MRSFSFRNGESFAFASTDDVMPSGARYAVMLASIPSLPEPRVDHATDKSVVAAEFLDGLWQWVQLCPSTKEDIGLKLEEHSIDPDRWVELIVFPVHPNTEHIAQEATRA